MILGQHHTAGKWQSCVEPKPLGFGAALLALPLNCSEFTLREETDKGTLFDGIEDVCRVPTKELGEVVPAPL